MFYICGYNLDQLISFPQSFKVLMALHFLLESPFVFRNILGVPLDFISLFKQSQVSVFAFRPRMQFVFQVI